MNKIYLVNKLFTTNFHPLAYINLVLLFCLLYNDSALGQAASSILPDIVQCKLEYPLDANGNDYTGVAYEDRNDPLIKNHIEPNLNNFVAQSPYAEYFYVENSEVVFKAHCAGALTSANAYPRCELRQRINGEDSFWNFSDEHEMNATFKVTHLPDIKREVCMLQIKGNTSLNTSGTKEAFRLEYREESDGLHMTKNETTKVSYIMPYAVGQVIAARLYVNNGNIDVELTNLTTGDTYNHSYGSDYPYGYFKAGCYTQSSIWEEKNGVGDEEPDAYGEVRFSELTFSGLECEANAPTNLQAADIFPDNAVLTWNPVATINTYDLRYRAAGDATWIYENGLNATLSTQIYGLSNYTTYEWQLKAYCFDGTSSEWSASSYFQTTDCSEGTNIAQYGTVVSYSSEEVDNPANNLIDLTNARWSAEGFPSEVVIDLGNTYSLNRVNLHPFQGRDYQFIVEGSTTSANVGFTTMIDASNNSDGGMVITKNFPPHEARFVKLIVTGAATYTGVWCSIDEFEVLCSGGAPPPPPGCTPTIPANFFANDIGSTNVTLNWTANIANSDYDLRYRVAGNAVWIYENGLNVVSSTQISGLLSDTNYEWQLKAYCPNGNSSEWSASNYFQTQAPIPANLCSEDSNIAEYTEVVSYSAEQTANPASSLTDLILDNRWSAEGFPQEVVIDLGSAYYIDAVNLHPYQGRDYQFIVQGSTTSANDGFTTMIDASDNTDGGAVVNKTFSTQAVRFVKLIIIGAATYNGVWCSIEEFEVLCAGDTGEPTPVDVQLKVFLEGGLNLLDANPFTGTMHTTLNDLGVLPGQTPQSPLVAPTPIGQPYNTFPWNYNGNEGANWTDNTYTNIETQYGSKVVDWVLVTFRTGLMASTNFAKAAAVLLEDGRVIFPQGSPLTTASPMSFYIMVEHRNHMGILTPTPITVNNGVVTYDFTTAASYGSFGQKELQPNIWGMFTGEIIHDMAGFDINGGDKILWEEQNGQFSIYAQSDLNLNGDINGEDKGYWFSNNGVASGLSR